MKTSERRITEKIITELLRDKHDKDVVVPQCKTGRTTAAETGELGILDVWVMKPSWSQFIAYGYEIKTSRGDFLGDDKWQQYLPYCHCFSFVCISGVILPEEVPAGVGLIYVSKNGRRLITKVKAPRREVQIPDTLYRYVLMSRAAIDNVPPETQYSDKPFWEEWLKHKQYNQHLGHRVSKGLARVIQEEVEKVRVENQRLKRHTEALEGVKQTLTELGINSNNDLWRLNQQVHDIVNNANLTRPLQSAIQALNTLNTEIKRIQGE
jgi:hypothetical protein